MLLQWAEQFTLSGDPQLVLLPAAKAEHITKNIPTAILFSEDGSKPCLFRMGSTSLSFKGMRIRMSTASNMVSQAAGNWKGRRLKLAISYLAADFCYSFTKRGFDWALWSEINKNALSDIAKSQIWVFKSWRKYSAIQVFIESGCS